jgi:hypothetical protein
MSLPSRRSLLPPVKLHVHGTFFGAHFEDIDRRVRAVERMRIHRKDFRAAMDSGNPAIAISCHVRGEDRQPPIDLPH